jgi:hypothetical protein
MPLTRLYPNTAPHREIQPPRLPMKAHDVLLDGRLLQHLLDAEIGCRTTMAGDGNSVDPIGNGSKPTFCHSRPVTNVLGTVRPTAARSLPLVTNRTTGRGRSRAPGGLAA